MVSCFFGGIVLCHVQLLSVSMPGRSPCQNGHEALRAFSGLLWRHSQAFMFFRLSGPVFAK